MQWLTLVLVGVGTLPASDPNSAEDFEDRIAYQVLRQILPKTHLGKPLSEIRMAVYPIFNDFDGAVSTCGERLSHALTRHLAEWPRSNEEAAPAAVLETERIYNEICRLAIVGDDNSPSWRTEKVADVFLLGQLDYRGSSVELHVKAVTKEGFLQIAAIRVPLPQNNELWNCYGMLPPLTRASAVGYSAIWPGLGQIQTEKSRGWVYATTALAVVGGAASLFVIGHSAANNADDAALRGDFELRDKWTDRRTLMFGLGWAAVGLFGAVHSVNIVDSATMDLSISWPKSKMNRNIPFPTKCPNGNDIRNQMWEDTTQ